MKREKELGRDAFMLLDGFLLGALFMGCYLLRSSRIVVMDSLPTIPPFADFYWLLVLIVFASPLLLRAHGFYEHLLSPRQEVAFASILKAGLWLILLITLSAVLGRLTVPSRSVFLLFLIAAPMLLMLRFRLSMVFLIRAFNSGALGERSVLVGRSEDIESFTSHLSDHERTELQIAASLDVERLGHEEIWREIRRTTAGRVVFVSPDLDNENLPAECEEEGIDIWIVVNAIAGVHGTPHMILAGRQRLMEFRLKPLDFWYAAMKRALDLVVASLGLVISLPLCLVITLAVKLTSPGPVIFSQVRSGKRGRRFSILKFRSMVADAPELHGDLLHQNEMVGPAFKIARDPRVTTVGAFLRKTSLDEIPQLVNVLRGEMSLVGPRPLPDYETEKIERNAHRRRLSVRPGITCLWQINGRNNITNFDDWVRMDLEYIDQASFLMDLWILLRTIPVVLFRLGAR
jgi:exopolysaccharide biosynthesis polyprenyl glycosylphosphotransferase